MSAKAARVRCRVYLHFDTSPEEDLRAVLAQVVPLIEAGVCADRISVYVWLPDVQIEPAWLNDAAEDVCWDLRFKLGKLQEPRGSSKKRLCICRLYPVGLADLC